MLHATHRCERPQERIHVIELGIGDPVADILVDPLGEVGVRQQPRRGCCSTPLGGTSSSVVPRPQKTGRPELGELGVARHPVRLRRCPRASRRRRRVADVGAAPAGPARRPARSRAGSPRLALARPRASQPASSSAAASSAAGRGAATSNQRSRRRPRARRGAPRSCDRAAGRARAGTDRPHVRRVRAAARAAVGRRARPRMRSTSSCSRIRRIHAPTLIGGAVENEA